jgi:hypothetical protein
LWPLLTVTKRSHKWLQLWPSQCGTWDLNIRRRTNYCTWCKDWEKAPPAGVHRRSPEDFYKSVTYGTPIKKYAQTTQSGDAVSEFLNFFLFLFRFIEFHVFLICSETKRNQFFKSSGVVFLHRTFFTVFFLLLLYTFT